MSQILFNTLACGSMRVNSFEFGIALFIFLVLPTLLAIACSVALFLQGLGDLRDPRPAKKLEGKAILVIVVLLWAPLAYVYFVPSYSFEAQRIRSVLVFLPLASIPIEFIVFLLHTFDAKRDARQLREAKTQAPKSAADELLFK